MRSVSPNLYNQKSFSGQQYKIIGEILYLSYLRTSAPLVVLAKVRIYASFSWLKGRSYIVRTAFLLPENACFIKSAAIHTIPQSVLAP